MGLGVEQPSILYFILYILIIESDDIESRSQILFSLVHYNRDSNYLAFHSDMICAKERSFLQ